VTQKKHVLKVHVHPVIADYVNNHKRRLLIELEDQHKKKVDIIGSNDIPFGEIRMISKANEHQKDSKDLNKNTQ